MLKKFTLVDTLLETFPEVSVARAASVCVPLRKLALLNDRFHAAVPVAGIHSPPSNCTSTLATPILSVAVPDTTTWPVITPPFGGLLSAMLGGVVSVDCVAL